MKLQWRVGGGRRRNGLCFFCRRLRHKIGGPGLDAARDKGGKVGLRLVKAVERGRGGVHFPGRQRGCSGWRATRSSHWGRRCWSNDKSLGREPRRREEEEPKTAAGVHHHYCRQRSVRSWLLQVISNATSEEQPGTKKVMGFSSGALMMARVSFPHSEADAWLVVFSWANGRATAEQKRRFRNESSRRFIRAITTVHD